MSILTIDPMQSEHQHNEKEPILEQYCNPHTNNKTNK